MNARRMLPLLVVAIAIGVAVSRQGHAPASAGAEGSGAPGTVAASADDSLAKAIASHAEDVPVTGSGEVVKLLPDDLDGSPHQRILVRVAGGGTVLIAHNIELAPRVSPLARGDTLEFAGDFVWNDKGGVVHWTHPDPQGRHRAGWIRRVPR
jgi:hypothetical protein